LGKKKKKKKKGQFQARENQKATPGVRGKRESLATAEGGRRKKPSRHKREERAGVPQMESYPEGERGEDKTIATGGRERKLCGKKEGREENQHWCREAIVYLSAGWKKMKRGGNIKEGGETI